MRHKFSFRQWLGAILALTVFTSCVFLLYSRNHEDARFERFINSFLTEELSANPVSFHFSVQDATAFHIDETALTLPVYQEGQALTAADSISKVRSQLDTFHPDRLTENNRFLYTLIRNYLAAAESVDAYPYYDEPLSPSSGVPSELPVLLAEYRITNTTDIENYFSILEQIPSYFDGLLIYEQEKAAAGLFMAEESADKVIQQCSDLMGPEVLASDTHFLNITFEQRLDALVDEHTLTESEKDFYLSQNDRLLTTVVGPAYDHLADGLTLLQENGKKPSGLSSFPGGRDYYTALVRQVTGSSRSLEDIKSLLYDDLTSNYNALLLLLHENPSLKTTLQTNEEFLPDMTPQEMLLSLQEQMNAYFPPFPADSPVSCTVKYVDASLEPYTAPAFYMLPCIDDVADNTIYINARDTSDRLSLFTTLAHEGYPGHLYQTVYCYQYWNRNRITPLRGILYYGGFTEGWAIYVELLSYDYAAAVCEASHPESALYYKVCRLDRQLQLGLYSLLDIAIHYDNASLQDVQKIFDSLGITNEQGISDVYTYIAEEPVNYLKYYLGYLEIAELKKQAAIAWYTDTPSTASCSDPEFLYHFHSFLLHNGPADFELLSSIIESR